jgi:hypothetical protein
VERPIPRDAAPPVEDAPGTFRLEGSALFEDGSPLPGVHFLDMVRGDDGEPEVVIEPCPIVKVESGADGAFTLGWPARPTEILLLVMCREAEVAAVGNGALLGPHEHGTVVSASGAGPLALTMRWRPGAGLVRGKDAATGEVRTWWKMEGIVEFYGSSFSMRWRLPGGGTEPVRGPAFPENPDGWLPVLPPGRTPEAADAGPGSVLEIVVEGYATARVPFEEMRGRVEVQLQPLVPDLVGVVAFPGGGDQEFLHGWSLSAAGGKGVPAPELRGAIEGPGPFSLSNLTDGRWTLTVWAVTPAGFRWARRTFEKAGGPVDLGAVEVSAWSGFRVRAVDGEGKPLGLPVGAYLAGEGIRSVVTWSSPFLDDLPEGIVIRDGKAFFSGRASPGVHSLPDPDPDGWVEIRDLAPGARYRLALPSLPGSGVEADAPETTGELRTVEIRVTARPVKCALRFTVEGGDPEEWGNAFEGTLPYDGWMGNGILEGVLFPGKYSAKVLAKRKGGIWKYFHADILVPNREAWEATIDLK